MDTDQATDLHLASLTVQRAALVTKTVLQAVDKGNLDKSDASPVTIADFAAQALIIAALHRVYPNDTFVGEEDSSALRGNSNLLHRTWELVRSTHLDDPHSEEMLYTPRTKEEMLDLIDLGGKGECRRGQGRIWVHDPVDGTATFMNGQQYAVCLALVRDGRQEIGVLGCPNLNLDEGQVREDFVDRDGYGYLLSAVAGHGVCMRRMGTGALLPGKMVEKKPAVMEPDELRFVDCQAASSTDSVVHGRVVARLGAPWPSETDVWAAQMRYVALAVGGCNAIVKIPRKKDYRSKVWDHAGGMLIAEEVGLVVSDLDGGRVDCGSGRALSCFGMVVAPPGVHGRVVETVRAVQQTARI